jgi:hypothetical protein
MATTVNATAKGTGLFFGFAALALEEDALNPSLPKFPSRGAETKGYQPWEWSILNGD